MNRDAAKSFAAALLVMSGCALFRWSGYREPAVAAEAAGERSAVELMFSTSPARGRPAELPVPERIPATLYYADLGPDTIDISDYPAQQKYNYAIFARQCARCHTLARAINSPVQSRTYWHYHLTRMSLRSRLASEGPIPAGEVKAILDFLDYDASVRKVRDKKRFDEETAELKRRFEPTLKRLLEHMQTAPQPRLLPSGPGGGP